MNILVKELGLKMMNGLGFGLGMGTAFYILERKPAFLQDKKLKPPHNIEESLMRSG
jgi:hypothetical protein